METLRRPLDMEPQQPFPPQARPSKRRPKLKKTIQTKEELYSAIEIFGQQAYEDELRTGNVNQAMDAQERAKADYIDKYYDGIIKEIQENRRLTKLEILGESYLDQEEAQARHRKLDELLEYEDCRKVFEKYPYLEELLREINSKAALDPDSKHTTSSGKAWPRFSVDVPGSYLQELGGKCNKSYRTMRLVMQRLMDFGILQKSPWQGERRRGGNQFMVADGFRYQYYKAGKSQWKKQHFITKENLMAFSLWGTEK
jgi:hypothetical protein